MVGEDEEGACEGCAGFYGGEEFAKFAWVAGTGGNRWGGAVEEVGAGFLDVAGVGVVGFECEAVDEEAGEAKGEEDGEEAGEEDAARGDCGGYDGSDDSFSGNELVRRTD